MAKIYRGNHSLRAQALKYWLWGSACFFGAAVLAIWRILDRLRLVDSSFVFEGGWSMSSWADYLVASSAVIPDSPLNFMRDWGMLAVILLEISIPAILLFSGFYFFRRYRTYRAGAEGERRVLAGLKGLSDSYSIFTNYCVARGRGWDEIDFLVVGGNGIFVIEAKNHSGKISGGLKDREWEQEITRRGRRIQRKKMKNPANQTMRHVVNIARFLKRGGIYDWVEGILVFSNSAASLTISTGELPVFRTGVTAARFITEYEPRQYLNHGEVKRVINYLRKNGV